MDAGEVLLKGCLESEVELGAIYGPTRPPFDALFDVASGEATRSLLRRSGLQCTSVPHAGRGVTLALAVTRSGGSAVALIPNEQLDQSMALLQEACAGPIRRGSALCVVLEDRPVAAPATCPRQTAIRLGIPCIEPASLDELRDAVGQVLRLSRAESCAVALVVHHGLLRCADMVDVRPNRVHETVDAMIVARTAAGRRVRRTESGGGMRTARRMELNRLTALPSPGEQVSVAFVTVGPAHAALEHLVYVLKLHGRVPVLHLRLLHPVDDAAVARLASRCDDLVVLEPRPGVVEAGVLESVERLRRTGARPALVWGRKLPAAPGDDEEPGTMRTDEVVHPSVLARRIVHLLHAIRPTMKVASRLVPTPDPHSPPVPRAVNVGIAAATELVRRMLSQVDQWLTDGAPLEEHGLGPSRLAVEGVRPVDTSVRMVVAEVWDPARFQEEGISALRQAARDSRAWIFVLFDFGSEDAQDMERLARGVVPEERADRVRIVVENLGDLAQLRETLREATLSTRLTVVIVRDGPLARYHVGTQERALLEVDRLGYEPRQRSVWPADDACAFREPTTESEIEPRGREGLRRHGTFSVDRLPKRLGARWRVGVRLLQERVDVVRTKAPAQTWRHGAGRSTVGRLPLPTPRHGSQAVWRVHLAGFRGEAPGAAALALCAAGRSMGFAVRWIYDRAPIAIGRRAWAQLTFTHPRPNEAPPPVTATIPFGEADLLVGLDPAESLRAIGADPLLRVLVEGRGAAVVNRGGFAEEPVTRASRQVDAALRAALDEHATPERAVVEDVAAACRSWFRTDRVTDVVLLGIAFQRGDIPVTLDAMETGLELIESQGFARSTEAFQFGRRLALEPHLLVRPRSDAGEEPLHILRRMVLLWRLARRRGRTGAEGLDRLLRRSLTAMPSLGDTEPGRRARRDFVFAGHRCAVWGGLDYAQRYCDMITSLYRVDRGDRGRALTRNAVLPLAEAFLIRDPLYVLAMAAGPARQRQLRHRFNVKPARGDQIGQTYLVRVEIVIAGRRVRLDVGIGRGLARLVAALRSITPRSIRGSRQDRERRLAVQDVVSDAIAAGGAGYERWLHTLRWLHGATAADRLRQMPLEEIRRVVDDGARRGGDSDRPSARGRPDQD